MILTTVAFTCGFGAAQPPRVWDGYCGLYAVYGAAVYLDHPFAFQRLIKPDYVAAEGSTLEQLGRAAREIGLCATPVSGRDVAALQYAPVPIIQHVRRSAGIEDCNHFVLFLGTVEGKAIIVDAATGRTTVPLGDLASRWCGAGLAVAKSEPRLPPIWASQSLWWAVVAIGTILSLRVILPKSLLRKSRSNVTVLRESMLVLMGAVALSVVYNLAAYGGLLSGHSGGSLNDVWLRHASSFLAEISREDLRTAIDQRSVVLIDARMPADYHRSHVPGAINIPATHEAELEQLIQSSGILPSSDVVVHCQSRACSCGDMVASALTKQGFSRLRLYRGGWSEWNTSSN